MWSEVVIGEGDRGCSAHTLLDLPGGAYLAHNRVSYWASGVLLEIGAVIFKDTDEGRTLTALIEEKPEDLAFIEAWLQELVIRHVPAPVLRECIRAAVAQGYREGQRDKAQEIRKALGLQESGV